MKLRGSDIQPNQMFDTNAILYLFAEKVLNLRLHMYYFDMFASKDHCWISSHSVNSVFKFKSSDWGVCPRVCVSLPPRYICLRRLFELHKFSHSQDPLALLRSSKVVVDLNKKFHRSIWKIYQNVFVASSLGYVFKLHNEKLTPVLR